MAGCLVKASARVRKISAIACNTISVYRLPGPGRLSSGDRLHCADGGLPRQNVAPRALWSGCPARRPCPYPSCHVPCRAGHVRRGCCPRRRRAPDCQGGGAPREPHVGLFQWLQRPKRYLCFLPPLSRWARGHERQARKVACFYARALCQLHPASGVAPMRTRCLDRR